MQIGDRIRARRLELGLTQDELAKKLDYKSRSTINKIEMNINDIPQTKIIEFANALDTTVQYLMGFEPKSKEKGLSTLLGEEAIDQILSDSDKSRIVEWVARQDHETLALVRWISKQDHDTLVRLNQILDSLLK